MLASQGWQPGEYLGAKDAGHSDHYSAANASHIRVLLREDNLGLGAKVGGNKAETFGLSLFSGVLGRLNGKGEAEVQKQQGQLRDAELRTYAGQKYGMVGFVSGGLLVGDKIEKPGQTLQSVDGGEKFGLRGESKKRKVAEVESEEVSRAEKKAKKSKGSEAGSTSSDEEEDAKSARRKAKKRAKRAEAASQEPSDSEDTVARAERKAAKRRRKQQPQEDASPDDSGVNDKARLKQEKRQRKEDRRRRKEEKRRSRAEKKASAQSSKEGSPAIVVHSVQATNGGRHAVRHRYIQQKRMASMNAQAMKEIFMVKAGA